MKTLRLLKRDFNLGLIRQWYRYIFIICLSAFLVYELRMSVSSFQGIGGEVGKLGVWDYLFSSMLGAECYKFGVDDRFIMPIMWFCFQIGIHYLIAYYPENDLREHGRQVLINSKSRLSWWFSKCVWCFVSVLLYFGILFGVCMLGNLICDGSISFKYDSSTSVALLSPKFQYAFLKDLVFSSLITPFFVTFAMCLIQMALSFVLTPVFSFAIICATYVASAYYTNPWLPGNYTMLLRSSYLDEVGVSPYSGLVIGVILIVISSFLGYIYFDNRDVM